MPGKTQIWQMVTIFLQYSLLALLYYFIWQVIKTMRQNGWQQPFTSVGKIAPQPSLKAYLEVTDAGRDGDLMPGQQFVLGETLIMGRSQHCNIIINDHFVSSEHACITRYPNGFSLTDLGSTNGTKVNNELISGEISLNEGDLIQVGPATFQFKEVKMRC